MTLTPRITIRAAVLADEQLRRNWNHGMLEQSLPAYTGTTATQIRNAEQSEKFLRLPQSECDYCHKPFIGESRPAYWRGHLLHTGFFVGEKSCHIKFIIQQQEKSA